MPTFIVLAGGLAAVDPFSDRSQGFSDAIRRILRRLHHAGATVVDLVRVDHGFNVLWKWRGADPELEPMVSTFLTPQAFAELRSGVLEHGRADKQDPIVHTPLSPEQIQQRRALAELSVVDLSAWRSLL